MNNTTYNACFICQEDYNGNNINITITNCNHKYHCSCLLHWLSIGKNCPYCNELLIENNVQATNMKELRKQILKAERIRIRRAVIERRERLDNEIKPILIIGGEYAHLTGKYTYWNNFKEYSDHYGKIIEEVKYFIEHNMDIPYKTIIEGDFLKIRGILSPTDLNRSFKEHFGIN